MKSFYTNGTILTMEDDALYAEAVCVAVSYTHLDVYKRQWQFHLR